MKSFVTLLLGAACAAAAAAPQCTGSSPATTVPLVELYTSEGCSSCPPAERYLATLRDSGAVVLALHVDYWDRLGWRDPFGRAAFSARQRKLADLAGSRLIYTPELFVSGRELRGTVDAWPPRLADALARVRVTPARAGIRLDLARVPGKVAVTAHVAAPRGGTLHLALVESGITSHVAAGENRGSTLRHDFVVREWLDPAALTAGTSLLRRELSMPAAESGHALAVAAFVEDDAGEVLQALAMPLCGS